MSITNVLVCDRDGDTLVELIRNRRPDLELRARTRDVMTPADLTWADAMVGFAAGVDLSTSSIRWVHSTGAGVDALIAPGGWPEGVQLTRSPGSLGTRIGEYCLAHALAYTQRLDHFGRAQSARRWSPRRTGGMSGTTVVVIGTGTVGRAIAQRFDTAGCSALGVSRRGRPVPPFRSVHTPDRLGTLVEGADWLVLAAPLTAETRGLVDQGVLARCRGTYVINVARGALVDDVALREALEVGRVTGASLDVFDEEPLPDTSGWWAAPGVRVTPHVAGVTLVEEAAAAFLDELERRDTGRPPGWPVDPVAGY